jgi:hypothetical protein
VFTLIYNPINLSFLTFSNTIVPLKGIKSKFSFGYLIIVKIGFLTLYKSHPFKTSLYNGRAVLKSSRPCFLNWSFALLISGVISYFYRSL